VVRSPKPEVREWVRRYLRFYPIVVSSVTVMERVRGYAVVWREATEERRDSIDAARVAYLQSLGRVLPVDSAIAATAGEILSLFPNPPTPPRQAGRFTESVGERLARWQFECTVAATALVAQMRLVHNNPVDFEAIRGAVEIWPERFPQLGSLQLVSCTTLV
jgi:predicted nucleic acid-binding protein